MLEKLIRAISFVCNVFLIFKITWQLFKQQVAQFFSFSTSAKYRGSFVLSWSNHEKGETCGINFNCFFDKPYKVRIRISYL